eukprot:6106018-Pleurochrysis_carterae.AAC.1
MWKDAQSTPNVHNPEAQACSITIQSSAAHRHDNHTRGGRKLRITQIPRLAYGPGEGRAHQSCPENVRSTYSRSVTFQASTASRCSDVSSLAQAGSRSEGSPCGACWLQSTNAATATRFANERWMDFLDGKAPSVDPASRLQLPWTGQNAL